MNANLVYIEIVPTNCIYKVTKQAYRVSAIDIHKGYQFYASIAHIYFDSSNTLMA